jgi:hypothetical protein
MVTDESILKSSKQIYVPFLLHRASNTIADALVHEVTQKTVFGTIPTRTINMHSRVNTLQIIERGFPKDEHASDTLPAVNTSTKAAMPS